MSIDDRTIQGDDGLATSVVKPWAIDEKHPRLRNYIGASSGARKRFHSACTYIDLYSGPGRVYVEKRKAFFPGSPLVALEESRKRCAFSTYAIADTEPAFVAACETRLKKAGAGQVMTRSGTAAHVVGPLISGLDPGGLHLAFLDPYNIAHLPFSIIQTLGRTLKSVDLLIHFSAMDLQRNVPNFLAGTNRSLDDFAPEWRKAIAGHESEPQETIRKMVVDHWCELIRGLNFKIYQDGFELVKGDRNQPLYWLVFASRHPLAHELWDKVRNVTPQSRMFG